MKSKQIITLGIVALVVAVALYAFTGSADQQAYVDKIEKQRKEKNHYLRTAPDSPFAPDPDAFDSLNYFPVDPAYRINARLTSIENKKPVVLATSDGKEKRYIEYAYAEFELHGVKNKLLILEIMEMGPYRGTLFLAFGDETSGRSTYGAGRYLDLKKVPGSTGITIDFNEAYNPYCAYNDSFSCPFPPRENILTIPIEAGEKNYKD